ncbi:MAG: metalloregulator ArsR/SmtB family transcription factor [Desulfosalsimonas sp.]|uniref:ArsR/SmtB family transcription factor n=1 Tax=Desulfosalsimonas sp. TaxID=3073848 RepID=UPI003970FE82
MTVPESQNIAEVCATKVIHHDIIAQVDASMPEDRGLADLAGFFKIFGDKTRIRILWALSAAEMCVCDLCCLLGMKQSAVSQQLRILKQTRLVKYRREGKVIYYSLDDAHIRRVLELGMEHVMESKSS